MPPMLGRRGRALRFADALDRQRRRLGAQRAILERGDRRQLGIEQIEIGKRRREHGRIGKAGELVLGRDLRHRHRALGERRDVAGDIVGRDHRGAAADKHAQADVVAFGALRFLDRAFAHADIQRHRAHRDRVGGIGAGAARGGHEPLGEIGKRGLVEQEKRTCGDSNCVGRDWVSVDGKLTKRGKVPSSMSSMGPI